MKKDNGRSPLRGSGSQASPGAAKASPPSVSIPNAGHKYGPSRLSHGNAQCIYCLATDLEITYALGPVCPNAPKEA